MVRHLFFVQHDDEMAENFDLMVEAGSAERAVELWRKYYWDDEEPDMDPDRVFAVRPNGLEGALPWNTDRMECVIDNR